MKTADRLLAAPLLPPFSPVRHKVAGESWQIHRDELLEAVATCPRLLADNVARYTQAKIGYVLEEFPSLAPPWPTFWIEYVSSTGRQRRGVLVRDLDGEPGVEGAAAAAIADARANGYTDDIRWVIELTLVIEDERHRLMGPMGWTVLALDPGGRCVGNRWVMGIPLGKTDPLADVDTSLPPIDRNDKKAVAGRVQEAKRLLAILNEQSAIVKEDADRLDHAVNVAQGVFGDQSVTYSDDRLISGLLPAFQSIAFLHCKNAVVDEVEPPAKLSARHRREHGRPLLRFQTVRLEVPRSRHERHASNGTGDNRALHIVPGHFAHYGDCCPGTHDAHGLLFGRLSGVYWMPQHMRGNPERGAVQTDYDLRVDTLSDDAMA